MISFKSIVAALLLSSLVCAVPTEAVYDPADITALRNNPYFSNAKIEVPVAQVCEGYLYMKGYDTEQSCLKVAQIANDINAAESRLFCSDGSVDAKYNPESGMCQVILGEATQLVEDDVWPGKNCKESIRCYAPFEAHWNPFVGECTCAVDVYPPLKSQFFQFQPNEQKEILYGPSDEAFIEATRSLVKLVDLLWIDLAAMLKNHIALEHM